MPKDTNNNDDLECKNCRADLTQPNSVSRDYIREGHYDKSNNFDPDNKCIIVDNLDWCTNCGDQIK